MEMPIDIIKAHIERVLAAKWLPDGAPSAAELATGLDTELQAKFAFIPMEEIEAVTVTRRIKHGTRFLSAGSGPLEASCGVHSNPSLLHNRAVNELALARSLRISEPVPSLHGVPAPMPAVAARPWTPPEAPSPRPGWGEPVAPTEPVKPSAPESPAQSQVEITIYADKNPTLWYMGTDMQARRLDEPPFELPWNKREAQIAMALLDLSASDLRAKTL